jgi:hypothetical protein
MRAVRSIGELLVILAPPVPDRNLAVIKEKNEVDQHPT